MQMARFQHQWQHLQSLDSDAAMVVQLLKSHSQEVGLMTHVTH